MKKNIRFLHSADLHLGSPIKTVGAMSGELQQILEEASYNAVEHLVDSALRYNVDFVLFSGDLYDRDAHSVKANQFLARQMERLNGENIPVCIIYGNHDPLGSAADLYKMPPNVKVFPWEKAESFTISDIKGFPLANVYGQSYRTASDRRKMFADFTATDTGIFNIGMLHTALTPGPHCNVPCSLEELGRISHIHYWALGHIHRTSICSPSGPTAAFPGIPQGRDTGEPGAGGCLLIEVDAGKPQVQFIPLSEIIWLKQEIPITEEEPGDLSSLEEIILARGREILSQEPAAFYPSIEAVPGAVCPVKGYIVRWVITGNGILHQAVSGQDREELSTALENSLRQTMGTGSPFLWTESVRFRTGSTLSSLMAPGETDLILQTLLSQRKNMETQPQLQQKVRAALGKIWYQQQDGEDLREDGIPYNDGKLTELLDRAQALVLERIIKERENLDH